MFTCCGAERALSWPKFGPLKIRKVINKVHHLLRSTPRLRKEMKGRYWSILKREGSCEKFSEREGERGSVHYTQFSFLTEVMIHLKIMRISGNRFRWFIIEMYIPRKE